MGVCWDVHTLKFRVTSIVFIVFEPGRKFGPNTVIATLIDEDAYPKTGHAQ